MMSEGGSRRWRWGVRLALLAFLWLVMTEGDPGSWIIGAPALLLGALAAASLPEPREWRWDVGGLLRFIPYFLLFSLKGSIDVSWRAFHLRRPLDPSFVPVKLRLPPGPCRIFMANTVNLLPGTLSADLDGDRLTVHMLDANPENRKGLQVLERRVADLFGVDLVADEEECDG